MSKKEKDTSDESLKDNSSKAKQEITEVPQEVKLPETPKESKAPNKKKAEINLENEFDWDSAIKDNNYTDQERDALVNDYTATLPKIEDKQVLDGVVVGIADREVVVDINFKSDGVISSSEFKYNKDLKIGDTVEVLIEKQEDVNGQLVLSHRRARVLRAWQKVNEVLETGETVNGEIKSRTKGGMIVDVFGIECFLPGSQIDVKPIRDYDQYVGKKMEFKVVKVNESFRNVVVSHKALIEADLAVQTKEIMSKLEKGQVIEGTVKNITAYGVFIDLGGIDGLIHITDLSWGRISHPEEVVSLDETIKVVILDFDQDKSRIQLGLKQLSSHPWEALDEKISVGDTINGKVVVVADYGVFVELQTGVEALLHVSEMSWSTHLRSASDFYKVGDSVEAKILTLDREERKMSLGLKQMLPDPWKDIEKKFPVDSKHKVRVRNFTNFGIFVELDEGIDGLVHISDLSWTKKIKHPAEFTKIDSMLDVVVLDIDQENRKISVGHKQTRENPWDAYEKKFKVDQQYTGTVKEMYDKGALVDMGDSIEAFCSKRNLEKEDGNKAKVGESLDFKIIEFSKENKRILVSHISTHKQNVVDEKEIDTKKVRADKKIKAPKVQKTTLGDLDDLSVLKEDLKDK
tara:strand:+ start:635 stop:2530 length:1896 start_codon:yes stop_codon:yes gene_type:complete